MQCGVFWQWVRPRRGISAISNMCRNNCRPEVSMCVSGRKHLAHTCKCATYWHIIHYSNYSADNMNWSATHTYWGRAIHPANRPTSQYLKLGERNILAFQIHFDYAWAHRGSQKVCSRMQGGAVWKLATSYSGGAMCIHGIYDTHGHCQATTYRRLLEEGCCLSLQPCGK